MKIIFFDNKLERFIESLGKTEIAKVLRTIDLLEAFASRLGMPHSKKIAPDIFELRIRGIREIRIFYTFHQEKTVLLHGYIKKSQKMPKREYIQAVRNLKYLQDTID